MMRRIKILFLFFVMVGSIFKAAVVQAGSWQQQAGEHFIVYYDSEVTLTWVQEVLRYAETYYDKIAAQIGYSRYQNFWTWDDRAKIIIYPDQKTFSEKTGAPAWTNGFVVRDYNRYHTRLIVTYTQEADFLEGILPHEISHLILRDFLGPHKKIPKWFDEGIAQLQEKNKALEADRVMKTLVQENKYLPLKDLVEYKIQEEKESLKVTMFYAESISVIHFLIAKYGSAEFGELCRNFKEDQNFESALKDAYLNTFSSLEDLEKKWLSYMQNE